ncbi:hypothetical protein BgiBS90_020087 [Biomphalaria glabrata]|nr:hypothetical protein BgiBS90_020087 [Biomphalaria glabrata]
MEHKMMQTPCHTFNIGSPSAHFPLKSNNETPAGASKRLMRTSTTALEVISILVMLLWFRHVIVLRLRHRATISVRLNNNGKTFTTMAMTVISTATLKLLDNAMS